MNKRFCLLVLLSFSLYTHDMSLNGTENVNMMNLKDKYQDLLELSHQYIHFINRIGSGEDRQGGSALSLFTPDFKKNFNGRWVAESRDSFVADLLAVHQDYGSWQLIPLDIMTVVETNRVILRINIEGKNFGKNTAIVILQFDSNNLISELIEVFSPIQTSYEFNDKK